MALETYSGPNDLRRHRCGRPLRFKTAHVSIHDARFGDACAGAGKVHVIQVPYCESCEAEPEASGCVHVPRAFIPVALDPIADTY
jgi:hypothetical protein